MTDCNKLLDVDFKLLRTFEFHYYLDLQNLLYLQSCIVISRATYVPAGSKYWYSTVLQVGGTVCRYRNLRVLRATVPGSLVRRPETYKIFINNILIQALSCIHM